LQLWRVEVQSTMMPNDINLLESQSGFVDSPASPGAPGESPSGPGVMVTSLEPGSRIVVATRHSCYRFVVIDGAQKRASVTGGKMFPESTEVRVEGSTNGSTIKSGWIGVGLRIELSIGLRRITTTPVESVSVEAISSAA
jgi:hypothetical protein